MTSQHDQQFGHRPYAAGVVTGIRVFRFHQCDGWCESPRHNALIAVTADYDWQPGENLATCAPPPGSYFPGSEHKQLAGLGCTCGFYAFFGQSNDYLRSMTFDVLVEGIIEGYGVVTIGDRGFRAEKARIIALVQPSEDQRSQALDNELARFGVPIYDTAVEALAAHPTTQPQDVGIEPRPDWLPNYARGGRIPGSRAQGGPVVPQPHLQHVHVVLTAGSMQDAINGLKRRLADLASGARDAAVQITGLQLPNEPAPSDPVARKRAASDAAADRRRQAGLKGVGGFDRRGRRR